MAGLGLLAAAIAAALPAPTRPTKAVTPRPASPPLDFSGVWKLDPSASRNASPLMRNAILSVTQKGNRIWIAPGPASRPGEITGDEVVADGRTYEKGLGSGEKGTVTADWTKDGQSLWIEIKAGVEGDPQHSAIQRSIWKLSADRQVWVRESVSISPGRTRSARLVFRRVPPPTPTAAPARPKKSKETG